MVPHRPPPKDFPVERPRRALDEVGDVRRAEREGRGVDVPDRGGDVGQEVTLGEGVPAVERRPLECEDAEGGRDGVELVAEGEESFLRG